MVKFQYFLTLILLPLSLASTDPDKDKQCVEDPDFGPGYEWDGADSCKLIPKPPKKKCWGGTNFKNPKGGDDICCKTPEQYFYDKDAEQGSCCPPDTPFSWDAKSKSGGCCPTDKPYSCACGGGSSGSGTGSGSGSGSGSGDAPSNPNLNCPGMNNKEMKLEGKYENRKLNGLATARFFCDKSYSLDLRPDPRNLKQVTSLLECAKYAEGVAGMYAAEYIRSTRMCQLLYGHLGDEKKDYNNANNLDSNPGVDVIKRWDPYMVQ